MGAGRADSGEELGVVPSGKSVLMEGNLSEWKSLGWILLSVLERATHLLWSCLPTCFKKGWIS